MTSTSSTHGLAAWKRLEPWQGLSWTGLVGAVLGLTAAMAPSLLPRPPVYLGLVAGTGAALGYGTGVFVAWVLHRVGVPDPPDRVHWWAWHVVTVLGPVVAVAVIVSGTLEQEDVRALIGEEPVRSSAFVVLTVTVLTAAVLLLAGRALRWVEQQVTRVLHRRVPAPVASLATIVILAMLTYWLAAGVLATSAVRLADAVYAGTNATTAAGVVAPSSPLRSGSPASRVSWESLGREGRTFVARGPTRAEIAAFVGSESRSGTRAGSNSEAGSEALEPIRVFVGLESRPTARERADLAVDELRRTGAFDRAVLVVEGAAGTGWTEPQQTDAIEHMWLGDTATVTVQYSYLPSWISFLVDGNRASDAGRELFDAVHAAWAELPADDRPRLVTSGMSLGSLAAQAPFASAADVAARTDGALFIGTPNVTPLWRTITRGRDAGSPEWQPVVRGGQTVRFAASTADLERPDDAWGHPRIVYLQHASDPVVWWSPDLLTREPDWLTEPRGPDVSSRTRWVPAMTFLQVTVDQFFGVDAPDGHGHSYSSQLVSAWAAVVPPDGWTAADTTRLEAHLDDRGR